MDIIKEKIERRRQQTNLFLTHLNPYVHGVSELNCNGQAKAKILYCIV